MVHIVDTTPTNCGSIKGLLLMVNTGLAAGTVTVADGRGTWAIITNPATGAIYKYRGFQGDVTVTASGACDLTVSTIGGNLT